MNFSNSHRIVYFLFNTKEFTGVSKEKKLRKILKKQTQNTIKYYTFTMEDKHIFWTIVFILFSINLYVDLEQQLVICWTKLVQRF